MNRESFDSLYKMPYHDPSVLNNKQNLVEAVNVNELLVQAGFPNGKHVAAGSTFTTYTEVWKPFSILYWSFILSDHDIGFSITKVASLDNMLNGTESPPKVLYNEAKIEASKQHCKGTLLIRRPGIFRLDFDNTHSWFNAKELKYEIFVLEPELNLDTTKIICKL